MTATTTPPPITEPTAWMRSTGAAQARRAARLTGLDLSDPAAPVVLAPLVGRLTTRNTREDRTCDRCGAYVPPAGTYCTLLYWPRPRLALLVGLCAEHARAEGVAL